ncbi:MAG: hypothetical protein ACRDGM_08775 [bacterium]
MRQDREQSGVLALELRCVFDEQVAMGIGSILPRGIHERRHADVRHTIWDLKTKRPFPGVSVKPVDNGRHIIRGVRPTQMLRPQDEFAAWRNPAHFPGYASKPIECHFNLACHEESLPPNARGHRPERTTRAPVRCTAGLGRLAEDGILHVMTRALDAAIAKLATLPADEQDRIAQWLLDELRDDEHWARQFATSQDALSKLAAEARADRFAGRATELSPDKL